MKERNAECERASCVKVSSYMKLLSHIKIYERVVSYETKNSGA